MKPILFFLCLFALLTLALSCACYADDEPPVVVDLSSTSAPPIVLTAGAVCAGPTCGRSVGLQAGQPVRNTGRVALAPLRAGRAVIAARPVRRVGAAIRNAAPGRRLARTAFAPVRWLLR